MAKTPGFTEYVDDRDSTITAQLRDNDPRTKSEWVEVCGWTTTESQTWPVA